MDLDIDATSGVIIWAIDSFQNGIISKKETDGLSLKWGDYGVVLQLINKMAHREGFGNIMAEGSLRASQMEGELITKADWDRMLDEYYHLHGWDVTTGWPTRERLKELDLDESRR